MYNGGEREQLMLLRTLQDNERNIIGRSIAPKSAVSVIQQQQQQQLGDSASEQQSTRCGNGGQQQQQQQQGVNNMPPYDPARLKKHGKNGQPPPVAVAKRNARERNRVKQVILVF